MLKRLTSFVSACYRETPPAQRIAILSMLLLLAVCVSLCPSCASTPEGLAREQSWYQVSTNILSTLKTVSPAVPAPLNIPFEGFLAAATAALVAWNTAQGRRLKSLENGSGKANGATSPTPQPPTRQ